MILKIGMEVYYGGQLVKVLNIVTLRNGEIKVEVYNQKNKFKAMVSPSGLSL